MVGWVDGGNKTILWDVPVQPDGFINVTSTNPVQGKYIFGQSRFPARDMHITSMLQRKIGGNAEEVLLGTCTVLIIAMLSEIVFSLLMHTRRRPGGKAGKQNIRIAFLVDECFHFRNLWRHLFRGKKSDTRQRESRRTVVLTSLLVLSIATTLMAADVFAVYLTQPTRVLSRNYQYNLRGLQPVLTDRGASNWVRRLTRERTCVTPVFNEAGQQRRFSLSACIEYNITEAHAELTDETEEITVRSFYHRAGSDHSISFGDAYLSMRKRAYIYMQSSGSRRLRFETRETPEYDYAKYIHEMYIHSAMQYNCNKFNPARSRSCEELVNELTREHQVVVGEVNLWRPRGGKNKLERVEGLETKFRVRMNNAFQTVTFGINPLVTTAVIEEVSGAGLYVNNTSEEEQDNVDGLLEEEGRVAGLVVLLGVLLGFVVVVAVLRACLVPQSLGGLAWEAESEMSFVGAGTVIVGENLKGSSSGSPQLSRGNSRFSDYDSAGLGVAGVLIGESGPVVPQVTTGGNGEQAAVERGTGPDFNLESFDGGAGKPIDEKV